MKIPELLQHFLEYLEIERGRSSKTVENYHHYLQRFFAWAKISEPEQITEDLVRKYRVQLNRMGEKNGRPLKTATQNYHVIALRNFLKYCSRRDISTLAVDKVEIGKTMTREVTFLEPEEVTRLLSAAGGGTLSVLRDRALLELLFSAGLRVSELVNVNRDQLNVARREFSVKGKGGKTRVVFVSDTAQTALEKYLAERTDIDPALFVRVRENSSQGKRSLRLTPRSVQRIVKQYATRAGIVKDVHPHTLRHSFATDLLINGADIRSVQAMLGHSSITTTQIYTHVTDQQLKKVHDAFHARRRKK